MWAGQNCCQGYDLLNNYKPRVTTNGSMSEWQEFSSMVLVLFNIFINYQNASAENLLIKCVNDTRTGRHADTFQYRTISDEDLEKLENQAIDNKIKFLQKMQDATPNEEKTECINTNWGIT